MKQAYIALGSNIEPRVDYLQQAVTLLNDPIKLHAFFEERSVKPILNVTAQSAVYDTVPKGYDDQADFLNMAVAISTNLQPIELLDYCQSIEEDLHRVRTIKDGPRTIDLDVLMYGDEAISSERLIAPHPRMHERAFVLFPLAEIAADVEVVTLEATVAELRERLPEAEKQDVRRLKLLENM